MFGSAKNSNTTGAAARTGIERAKVERVPDQHDAAKDDLVLDAASEQGAVKAAVAKSGFTFPEKARPKSTAATSESAAHLYVGANIRLKGEIVGCDMMRIEGTFEGTAQARQLILCPGGAFIGTAQIEEAEIEGTFEGTLQVRGRLFLRSKGRIRGVFSYGQLEIERGGTVEGKIIPYESRTAEVVEAKPAEAAAPRPAPVAATVLSTPAAPTVLPAPAAAGPRPVQAQVVRPAVAQPAAPAGPKPVSGLNGAQPANQE